MKTSNLQPLEISQQLLILRECQLHFRSDFLLRRSTPQSLRYGSDRLFNSSSLTPQLTWTPVQAPQRIENCTAYPELRITFKLNLLAVIEFRECINQTYDAGRDQIIEVDMLRQTLVNAASDIPNGW